MIQYFPEPYEPFVGNVKVELDLSNYYATKADLKGATGIDASNVALNSNLAKLKAEVNKIYVDKLKTVPDDLSKLSNVVNNEAVKKKTLYDKLIAKVNAINTSGFFLQTKYDADKSDLEKKINDVYKKNTWYSGLVKKKGL